MPVRHDTCVPQLSYHSVYMHCQYSYDNKENNAKLPTLSNGNQAHFITYLCDHIVSLSQVHFPTNNHLCDQDKTIFHSRTFPMTYTVTFRVRSL